MQGMVKITGYGEHCVKKGCRRQRLSQQGALDTMDRLSQ
jgi:hypothetical protein